MLIFFMPLITPTLNRFSKWLAFCITVWESQSLNLVTDWYQHMKMEKDWCKIVLNLFTSYVSFCYVFNSSGIIWDTCGNLLIDFPISYVLFKYMYDIMCSLLFKMMWGGYREVQERGIIHSSFSSLLERSEKHTQYRQHSSRDTDIVM